MIEWTGEEVQKITEAIERIEFPELRRGTWNALRDGAELIWDGDEIVGLVFDRHEVGVVSG